MEFEETIALLGELELFADFTGEELRLLAFVTEAQELLPGDVLQESGAVPGGAYVLVSGELAVREPEEGGGRSYRIFAPAVVGELSLILARPRGAAIKARTRAKVLFVPREPFLKLLRTDPALAESVAARIRASLTGYIDAIGSVGERFSGDK